MVVVDHGSMHRAVLVQLCVTVIFMAYALTSYFTVHSARTHSQFFTERDPSLSYPSLSSTVPSEVLAVTSSVVPGVAVVVNHLLRWRVTRHDGAVHLCLFELFGLAQSIFLTMGTYNAVKQGQGRLPHARRPHTALE